MIYIFLSGVLGFLVYDGYRIHKTFVKTGRLEFTFFSLFGFIVHVLVYVSCGILGIFANLDVLSACCNWSVFTSANDSMVGPALRAFAIGLAGPAGLSKGKTSLAAEHDDQATKSIDDLTTSKGVAKELGVYLKILFMR